MKRVRSIVPRTHLKNDFTVILNEILLSVNLDEVKNLVRIGHFQADSSTCKKHKSQNDDEKSVFEIASKEIIAQRIFLIRGQKVLISSHLAELYHVEHKVLMQAVRRNAKRFPPDFLFQLTQREFGN